MPRKCTICTHREREAIDHALVEGTPQRAIAALYRVSQDALNRHRVRHLTTALAAKADAEMTHADRLLAELARLRKSALAMIDRAEANGDERTLALALREARACLELQGRLVGVIGASGVAIAVKVTQPTPPAAPTTEEMAARFDELVRGQAERLKRVPKDRWTA